MSQTKGALIDAAALGTMKIGVKAYMHGSSDLFFEDQLAKDSNTNHSYAPSGAEAAGHWAPLHTYYWPKAHSLDFWAWAPATANTTVSDFSIDNTKSELSFTYTIPTGTAATAMPDLMFASNDNQSKESVSGEDKTGCVNLGFSHALAAVKFKVSTDYDATVTKISIESAINSGSCVYKNGAFTWTPDNTSKATFAQEFTTEVSAKTPTEPKVEETISGAKYNTAIFMMVPQTLTATGQKVSITFNYTDKAPETYTGYLYTDNVKKWDAGHVYVYSITLPKVEVTVDDEVEDNVKKNVVITNSGNVDAYLRASIVANWVNDNGFVVAPWVETTGTFVSLCPTGWIKNEGFYYFTGKVEPGEPTSAQLFATYTAPASPIEGAHLVMDIIVQAVAASKDSYKEAWKAAANVTFPEE